MIEPFMLSRQSTALLVIDVQEKLMSQIERPCEIIHSIRQVIKGFQILKQPIYVSEQYPQGLGRTVPALRDCLGEDQQFLTKTTFSCLGDPSARQIVLNDAIKQWVLVGIEAHVCVLQTAKELISANKQVVVLNNAISSRSIYDFSTAIAEMRDMGIRVSSVETILFELMRDSQIPEFKAISQLIR